MLLEGLGCNMKDCGCMSDCSLCDINNIGLGKGEEKKKKGNIWSTLAQVALPVVQANLMRRYGPPPPPVIVQAPPQPSMLMKFGLPLGIAGGAIVLLLLLRR